MRKRILSAQNLERFLVIFTAIFGLLSILGLFFGFYWAVRLFFKPI